MRSIAARERLGLLAVLAVAALAGLYWTYRVPFYEQPDELAHADYVFALYDARAPFVVRNGDPTTEVAPQSRYLESAVSYRRMRYNPGGRAPASYGTAPYFRAVDARAPEPSGRVPQTGDRIPYMMTIYPYTYYAVAFAAFSAVEASTHSLALGMLAMRGLGSLAICATLALGYFTLRRYRVAVAPALAATLGLGLFPLLTGIASSIQPDTFVIAWIALALYAGSMLRRRRDTSAGYALLCLALVGLAMTKQHYAAAVWIASLPLAVARRRRGDWPWIAALVALPPCALAFAYTSFGPVHGIESAAHFAARTHTAQVADRSAPPVLALVASSVASALDGSTAHSFWLTFGYRGGRIFGNRGISEFIVGIVDTAFVLTLAIVACRTLASIARVARKRSLARALALVAGGHALNVTLAVTAVLFAATILSSGALELQGRYWAPVTLALTLVMLVTLPRELRVARRRRAVRVLATAMAAYGTIAFACATVAMNANYYGPVKPSTFASVAEIRSPHEVALPVSGAVTVSGVAIDMQTGFPASAVFAEIDGARGTIRGTTGLASPALARLFNDPAVGTAGFAIRVAGRGLAAGTHTLTVFAGHAGSGGALPIRDRVAIDVAALPILQK